ncbi:MAG: carboxypeptidase-like regulatory domain-containing protein, partial [Acidobacteriota bacterium]
AALLAAALPRIALGIEVTVVVRGPVPARPVHVQVLKKPMDGTATASEEREVSVEVSGQERAELGIDKTRRWRVRAQAEGFWSEERVVEAGAESNLELTLWPAGVLRGRIILQSPGDAQPEAVLVQFAPTVASGGTSSGGQFLQGAPSGVTECPVEKRGYWRCAIPAGAANLRIRAKGQPPRSVFRQGVLVKVGEVADLGDLELAVGSSVSGRLRVARNSTSPENGTPKGVSVQILKSMSGAQTLITVSGTVVGPDGSFAFSGLLPGHYVVLASGGDYLPDRYGFDLGAGDEIELPPLDLSRACRLRVGVSPPSDPRGAPWKVLLYDGRPQRGAVPVHEAPVDPSGAWAFDRTASGRPYRLKLLTSWDEPWWFDATEFTPSGAQTSREVHLDIVSVTGTARLGKQPLSGHLTFSESASGVSVSIPIAREGRFAGPVPRAGTWQVLVSSDAPPVRRKLDVEVPRGGGEIALDLPPTAVEGEIVDETGRRVPGVTLTLTRLNPAESMTYLLEDGTIFVAGLAPGEYKAYARRRDRESSLYKVMVNEDGSAEPSPLRIVAKLKRVLHGRVVSPDGVSVAGASIQLVVAAGDVHPYLWINRTTDEEGRFTIDLRDDQKAPCLLVLPKGLPARILQVSDTDQEQLIATPQAGGVLQLSFERPTGEAPPSPVSLKYLFHGNCIAPVNQLATVWKKTATIGGENFLETLSVEASAYTLCGLKPGEIRTFSGGPAPYANCSSGILTGQGQLTLRVK